MGTLKRYVSSKDTYREFCRVCGAFVFWHSDADKDRPKDVIDVSIGMLEAETGALAEAWVEWHVDEVIFLELAQNKPLFEKLAAGMKEWGGRRKRA